MFFIKKTTKIDKFEKGTPYALLSKKQPKFLSEVLRNYLKNKGGGSSGMNSPDWKLFRSFLFCSVRFQETNFIIFLFV